MSMPLMEKGGIFTEPVFFPIPSPFDINQNIGHLVFKKMQYACAHTPVTLCTIKEWGRGKERNRENYSVVIRMGRSKLQFSNLECLLDLEEQNSGIR